MAISPILQRELTRYGLGSLASWASNAIINGWSEDQIMIEMWQRQEFKDRFAGIFMLEKAGKPPISIDEYLSYEKTIQAQASMWGMTLTKAEVDNMIGNNISPVEAERRFDIAAAALFESPQETRDELVRLHNISYGEQMKFWMNPKEELGNLQQKFRMAELSGAAIRTGYGLLNLDQARKLTESGLTREQALTGFGELVKNQELFQSMDIGEATITQDQQIALLAGDASVAELVESRKEKRVAEFAGGGGFAVGKEGFATGVAQ